MEMQFEKIPVTYLRKLTDQSQSQEQTLEVRLPDSMPDIGRVLGAWGQVIVRGKEWNRDDMSVSCGVMAWVLYAPEEEEGVRSVEAWIPFTMKWDLPESQYDGKISVSCLLRSLDARSTSARKLIVRATLDAMGEAWESQQVFVAAPNEVPEDVMIRKESYPVLLPQEAGEKAFLMEDEIPMPATAPKPERILSYSLQPEILDKKVMADKIVFRGNGLLHILYRGEDGKLHTFNYDIPFSQYAELSGEYDGEPTVTLCPCVTSLDVTLGENGELQLKAGILGQYLLYDRTMIATAVDAYSLKRSVTLMQETLQLPSVLDQTAQILHAEQFLQGDVQQIIDAAFYPGYGQTEHCEQSMRVAVPGLFQILYYNADGEICNGVAHWEGNWNIDAAEDSKVDVQIHPMGRWSAVAGVDGVGLRGDILLQVTTTSGRGIGMLAGLELGELKKPDPNRPSLILCKKGKDSLWDIAKRTGSEVEAILTANHLQEEPEDERVLLIPIP